ncbi:MAG: ROK family glucokinase [Lachnospiraceae bacterium]|nr:ROK family glucokinase [Lachnospiraceae bacterium]
MEKYCFGVDIGGTTVKLGLFTNSGNLVDKWEITTNKEDKGTHILSDIAQAIDVKLQEKNIQKDNVIGIGIGVPGPVKKARIVNKCVNLGWDVIDVVEQMTKLTGVSNIKVGNDANVAALGEALGTDNKRDNVVMLTLGTGVGGGVIIDGNIICGNSGAAGELGHIQVKFDEEDSCGCGKKGCLEQYASATGIVKEAHRYLKAHNDESKLRQLDNITAKDIFDLAKEGDKVALILVDSLGQYLGVACSHIASVVDPEAFIIGGGVSKAGDILITNIEKYYNQYAMEPLRNKPFEIATLGNDAGIFGCANMILG